MKISLGSLAYLWDKNTVYSFYEQVADTPVDIVYLGETVCHKRSVLNPIEWQVIAKNLHQAGKEVVLSTLALPTTPAEWRAVEQICCNEQYSVEANDMAAIHKLAETGHAFTAGPSINIYNPGTLLYLNKIGLQRWVPPVELSSSTITEILTAVNHIKVETEIFSYGKLPLAYSARCFSARACNLPKDDCQLSCAKHSNGLTVTSQENHRLFSINGIQTQSGYICDLRSQWQVMHQMGVDILRFSPDQERCLDAIQELYEAMQHKHAIKLPLNNNEWVNGYWFGQAGFEQLGPNV